MRVHTLPLRCTAENRPNLDVSLRCSQLPCSKSVVPKWRQEKTKKTKGFRGVRAPKHEQAPPPPPSPCPTIPENEVDAYVR